MDIVTLSMAKAYSDSQRLAYSEGLQIVWDGKTNGLTSVSTTVADARLYKVSDIVLAKNDVLGGTVTVQSETNGAEEIPCDASVVVEHDGGALIILDGVIISGEAGTIIEEIKLPEGGTYFMLAPGEIYIKALTKETIHPIDPKYLPGVCLPVVELSTIPTAEGAPCTAEEAEQLTKVASLGMPVIAKISNTDNTLSAIMSYLRSESIENVEGFIAQSFNQDEPLNQYLTRDGVTWFAVLGS